MEPQLNRRPLKINNRTSVEQKFIPVTPKMRSETRASIFTWASRGRGVQGESVNAPGSASEKQLRKY